MAKREKPVPKLQRGKGGYQVVAKITPIVGLRVGRLIRIAVAPGIERINTESGRQRRNERIPNPRVCARAVRDDEGRPIAAMVPNVDFDAAVPRHSDGARLGS
jgi:hypothetical protein